MSSLVEAARATGLMFDASDSGRWVRLWGPSGGQVYVAEYSWDEDCEKHYVLFRAREDVETDRPTTKYMHMQEAITAALRQLRAGVEEPAIAAVEDVGLIDRLAEAMAAGR